MYKTFGVNYSRLHGHAHAMAVFLVHTGLQLMDFRSEVTQLFQLETQKREIKLRYRFK